jgi:2'-5' RNA ligase
MRLFVALSLPAEARTALAAWTAAAAPEAMRRVPAQNLHVTLAFLGARSPGDAEAVAALLDGLARPLGPLTVEGPLWLPPRRPGVLAVALGARPPVAELHAELVEALASAIGFEAERRALRLHVTVARARREARLRAVELDPPPPALRFEPEALVLYRSHRGAGAARYEALARAGVQ